MNLKSYRPIHLILLAASFHVVVACIVFVVGRQQLMPSMFDRNGTAISVTRDGIDFRNDATELTEMLWRGDLRSWFSSPYSFHIKIYSVSFAIFGRLLGFNILAAEPLSVLLYVSTLMLVYMLAIETFHSYAGLVAATIVGLWPSLLLHETQLVKDPLFIFEMLALVFVLSRLVTRSYTFHTSMLNAVGGGLLAILVWKTRSDLGVLLVGTVILGAMMLGFRQFQIGRVLMPNMSGMVLIIAITAVAILFVPVSQTADNPRELNKPRLSHVTSVGLHWWQWAAHVGKVRQRFIESYPDFGSNIDTDIRIESTSDLMRFLPRAIVVGLFAPFPRMWFENGKSVGSTARRISGLETLLMYAIEGLALLALWRYRRSISVWLLFFIAIMGIVALGLVVVNVGTLYRLRYLFLILIIIIASGQIAYMIGLTTPGPKRDCE